MLIVRKKRWCYYWNVCVVVLQAAMSCETAGERGGICGGTKEKPRVRSLSP